MLKKILFPVGIALGLVLAFFGGYFFHQHQSPHVEEVISYTEPEITNYEPDKDLPLNKFAIPTLTTTSIIPSAITIERVTVDEDDYQSVIFSFFIDDKKMSGLANLPKNIENPQGTILMMRGYAPLQNYVSGTGTKNAALYFVQHGYQTFAPDFLGYAESDPTPADSWQARFEKPYQMMQLLSNLEHNNFQCNENFLTELTTKTNNKKKLTTEETAYQNLCAKLTTNIQVDKEKIGIWAHSNGGQITLTLLETTGQALPTTLWAPVSVGFPYSVLFFTDEYEDEGKGMRKYIGMLEEDYDVYNFSHTSHLDKLAPNIKMQLHHGTADDAALVAWSDEFVEKIKAENKNREQTDEIDLTYYRYSGADHNLRPSWDTVVARDVEFFNEVFDNINNERD